jgi:hypothetical protein
VCTKANNSAYSSAWHVHRLNAFTANAGMLLHDGVQTQAAPFFASVIDTIAASQTYQWQA